MPKYRIIKWRRFSEERPVCNGDYMVLIENAEIPTILTFYDEENLWIDDNENSYSVKYWCVLPEHPDEKIDPSPAVLLNSKVTLHLTLDEVVSFRENLSFVNNFCDVPDHSYEVLEQLIVYLENIAYIGRQ